MRVLVTGGTGFLGSHVIEQLAHVGHSVRALVRRTSDRRFLSTLPNVEFVEGSVEDATSLARAVAGVEGVVHSAGLVKARSPDEFHRVNADGTAYLLEAVRKNAPELKRFVLVSSLAVAGPSDDGRPVTVDRQPRPVTHYGRSKLAGERVALEVKDEVPLTILRPSAIYGPRDTEIFALFQAVSRGVLPTVGLRDSTMSVVYGADAAHACLQALEADVPSGATYFVDDGAPMALTAMLEEIERALGKRAYVRMHLPLPVVYAAAFGTELFGKLTQRAVMLTRDKVNEIRQPHWVCSSESTRRDLGWQPSVGLAEGVGLTARWYRENGWL